MGLKYHKVTNKRGYGALFALIFRHAGNVG
jgi:hypothetical protein